MAKILIVDDSGLSRRTLRRILESAGHQVTEAEDGIVALERYFLERPDMVFLDLIMEDMDGMEVLRKLRQIDPQACVVIASADVQNITKQLTMEGGACGFINKPFNPETVLKAVESAMAG